jgi:hypothetical protein
VSGYWDRSGDSECPALDLEAAEILACWAFLACWADLAHSEYSVNWGLDYLAAANFAPMEMRSVQKLEPSASLPRKHRSQPMPSTIPYFENAS